MTEHTPLADHERRALVAAIHDADTMLVLAVAGGGNAVITDLLDIPGASRTVLEVIVPYADTALADLLRSAAAPAGPGPGGSDPDAGMSPGAVSQATAEAMAAACLDRARRLAPHTRSLVGVGCTAALVSDRPKRGDHRAHVAIASVESIEHRLVTLEKGTRDRVGEDRVVADAVLDVIAAACGVGHHVDQRSER